MDISSRILFFLFWSLLVINVADIGTAQDEVKVARCKHHGPDIRFPFWLRGQQQGYPGFELSCNEKKDTVLILPRSVQLFVKDIDYKAQQIHVYDPDSCLPKQLPNLNISASAFKFPQDGTCFSTDNSCNSFVNFTLYNCSSREHKAFDEIPCLSSPGHKVYGFSGHYDGYEIGYSMVSCSKIADISLPFYVRFSPIPQRDLTLNWSKPMCSNCEANGQGCRLKNNGAQTQTECFNFNIQRQHTGGSTKLVVTGLILGSFLLALVIFGLYYVYQSNKKEKENQVKIKKFLEDYNASKPARYSYADIKRITNQFKDKVGQGGYGTVFKGSLSNDVLVAVKVLNNFKGNGEEFINEVGSMSRIHHINVARLVGFCADGYKRALVYEFLPNESLEKFIFSEKGKNRSLGYEKLHDIAQGIAKGIEYLHQGCDQQILHFDIKPHNILLDHNFNPKISDFGLAKLCSKDQSAVSMTAARGTMGYIAPEVLSRNFGNVSHKSDVYSFGMLLLEMVGGRKNVDVTVESASQVYFPEWIYNNLEKGDELGIRIEDERHAKIARKLTIVGLRCIQWHPTDRPAMKVVVQMLEGEEDNLTMPPNPFASTDQMMMSATMNKRPFNRELAVISELE